MSEPSDMQVEEAFLRMAQALGLQATPHAHLDAAAIKEKADASASKDARIAVLGESLRTSLYWLNTAHGKTAVRERIPGIEETWVIDLSPGIEAVEATLAQSGAGNGPRFESAGDGLEPGIGAGGTVIAPPL